MARRSSNFALFLICSLVAVLFVSPLPHAHAAYTSVPCGAAALRTAVQNAASGDILDLAYGCTYTFTTGDSGTPATALPIGSKSLTIYGNTSTIARSAAAGTPAFRLFSVTTGGNLTLESLVLQNGYTPDNGSGGAISVFQGDLTLYSINILDNSADYFGGGIYITEGSLYMYSTNISGNSTRNTTNGNGGGIYSRGTLTIGNSNIDDNTSMFGGGLAAYTGTVDVQTTTLFGNVAYGNGGGIYNDYDSTLTVNSSSFLNNQANGSGGAIENYQGMVEIVASQFSQNTGLTGGSVDNYAGTVTLKDSQFSQGTANSSGGSIANSGTLDVTNTFFTSETATISGGSIHTSAGTATIKNSFFAYNHAYDGGAVNATGGTLHIYDTQFYVNTATGNGGGIQAMGSSVVTLKGGNIGGNTADSGAGLLSTGTASVSIDGTTFISNTATSNGGGLNTYTGTMNVINSTFANNVAAYGGGINTYGGGHVTVSSTIFTSNAATTQGGGLNSAGNSVLKANESCIQWNSAPQGGGVFNGNATALDAKSNWWGHPSGPSGNAFGSGDNISASVTYLDFKSIAPDRCDQLTVPANDLLEAPANIASLPTNLTLDPRGATVNFNEPNLSCAANRTDSVWYKYTPSASGLVTIDTAGSEYNTAVAVYTGGYAASFANFVQVGCNDNPASGQQAKLQAYMEAGKSYFIQVAHVGTTPLTDPASSLHLSLVVLNNSVSMTVIPQGRPAPPSPQLVMQLHVTITPQGGSTPVFDQEVTTDNNGKFNLAGVTPGNYHLWIKVDNALAVSKDVTLAAGNNNVDLPTPPTGDTDGNNVVNLTDFSLLAGTFGKQSGNPGYDGRADFNGDTVVNLTDFSLLATSFGKTGAP